MRAWLPLGMAGLGLVALSLIPFGVDLPPHDAQRLVWAVLLAALGLMGFALGLRPGRAEAGLFLLVLAAGSISALGAKSPPHALLETLSWLAMLAGVFVLARAPYTRKTLGLMLALIALVSSAYYLRFAIAYLAAALEHLPLYRDALIDGFSNIRFHSQFQTWTLPLLLAATVLATGPRARALWLVTAALGFGLLFVAGTRGSLLGLGVSTLVVMMLLREHARAWLITVLAAAFGGAVFYLVAVFALPAWLGLDNTDLIANSVGRDLATSSGRTLLWSHSLALAAQHPWLGVGPMHFACDNPLNLGAHPHNLWLQFLAEWGLPFTLAMSLGFIYLALRWVRRVQAASPEARALALPLAASLSAALTHALFSGLGVMPVSQFYGVLLFAWALAWWRGAEAAMPPARPAAQGLASSHPVVRTLTLALALPGLIVLAYAVLSLPKLDAAEDGPPPGCAGRLQPRFWSQGLICLDAPVKGEAHRPSARGRASYV